MIPIHWPLLLDNDYLVFEGGSGPAKGKTVVFLAGDEEYRSEEGLPMLARLFSSRFGFRAVVSFSINAKGEIDPTARNNQPGIEELDKADLCIMLLRFREWPDHQTAHFVKFLESGKPIIALRTSTHAFSYASDSKSPFEYLGWQSKTWQGGFGEVVLGETWLSHWGKHGEQATRALSNPTFASHPILNGVGPIFADSDVYEAYPPSDAKVLLFGQVLNGMSPTSSPLSGSKNEPMMPVAWLRTVRPQKGNPTPVFTTTLGAATDLRDDNLRRLVVNAAFHLIGKPVPKKADVSLNFPYFPSPFGFGKYKVGVKPSDFQIHSVP